MQLVARASKTVFIKNFVIVIMCAVALGMFWYDGFYGYPSKNDHLVKEMIKMTDPQDARMGPEYRKELESWKGWSRESDANRRRMDEIATVGAKVGAGIEGWKKVLDITIQRWCAYGLVGTFAASLWWIIHCQRRRVIADADTVSPALGITIPWNNITLVDNTRWKSTGIVDITYNDVSGTGRKAKFDDYEVEREPLLKILDQLAEKALNADFIPKEEPPAEPAAANPQGGGA